MTTTASPRATITTPSDREIRIERIFNAPPEQVWKALTDPDLVRQWWGRGHTLERNGMLQSGMESGVNESFAALDRVLGAMQL